MPTEETIVEKPIVVEAIQFKETTKIETEVSVDPKTQEETITEKEVDIPLEERVVLKPNVGYQEIKMHDVLCDVSASKNEVDSRLGNYNGAVDRANEILEATGEVLRYKKLELTEVM